MKIWTCGSPLWSGSQNAWTWIKNVNGASCLSNFWNFFSAIHMISCRVRLVTMDETWLCHSDLETKQQSVEWRHNASPCPKKFQVQKSAGKVLASIFWDQDGIFIIDYLPKGQTLKAEYYSSLLVKLKDIFKENAAGRSPSGACPCTTMPRLTGYLQPRRNWRTWASIVLIIYPILRIWPHRTTTCPLDWKKNWNFAIFHPTRRSLLPRRPGWTDNILNFFWVVCKS